MNETCNRMGRGPASERRDDRPNAKRLLTCVLASGQAAVLVALAGVVAAAPGPKAPAPDEQARGGAAMTTVKGSGVIEIDSSVIEAPAPGNAGRIEIRIKAAAPLESVEVTFGDAGALDVVAVVGATALSALGPGDAQVLTLGILAAAPGRYRLPVFVSAASDRGSVASSVVVPIEVSGQAVAAAIEPADPATLPDAAAPADRDGADAVRSMRATETIR